MFDKSEIRVWIAVVWLLCFATLWLLLEFVLLPKENIYNQISEIERNIHEKEWKLADKNVDNLTSTWKKYKVVIQLNNASNEVVTFEQLLSQLKTLVSMQKKESITSASRLKEAGKSITKSFPSP